MSYYDLFVRGRRFYYVPVVVVVVVVVGKVLLADGGERVVVDGEFLGRSKKEDAAVCEMKRDFSDRILPRCCCCCCFCRRCCCCC